MDAQTSLSPLFPHPGPNSPSPLPTLGVNVVLLRPKTSPHHGVVTFPLQVPPCNQQTATLDQALRATRHFLARNPLQHMTRNGRSPPFYLLHPM